MHRFGTHDYDRRKKTAACVDEGMDCQKFGLHRDIVSQMECSSLVMQSV